LKLKDRRIQISCDGGAATGKTTGAKLISKHYRLRFMSSGLLYRYASYLLIKYKPKNKIIFLKKKFKNLKYKKLDRLNLHSPKISKESATIAKKLKVREVLRNFQINFAKKNKNCCIEGRDIATKILPNSDIKFYFKCNLNTAVFRRFKELKKKDKKIKLKDVKKALISRDKKDRSRRFSPLQKHPDAVIVNAGKLTKQAMLAKMIKHVENVLKQKYGK
tara:strand:+ start:1005 stop:1661 length:657 start_codon:yes stop_codon:yes gene_type:complete